jgi:hypothetical protein
MANRSALWLTVLACSTAVAACGGGGSSAPTTAEVTTTAAADTTVPVTETVATEAPTTLPPTIDLSALPGRIAVIAFSCSTEPFVVQDAPDDPRVCTLRPDGTDTVVVSQPGEMPRSAGYTNDGKYLLYNSEQGSFVVDMATGAVRPRGEGEVIPHTGSQDDRWFLARYRDGLYIYHHDSSPFPDGTQRQLVVADPLVDADSVPRWSPDSQHFAYLSWNDGTGGELPCPELWIGNIDEPPVQVTDTALGPDGPGGCPASIRWSPDGSKIMLMMLGMPMFTAENIYTINPDGTDLTALTHAAEIVDENATSWGIEGSSRAAAWSPDGSMIAFIMGDGVVYHLYVMNADGSQLTLVENAPAGLADSITSMAWGPD